MENAVFMERIEKQAYAKINLGLDVLRRREDGYHEVKMIMQTVGICDTLTFIKKESPGIILKTNREDLSTGEDNLICRAAELLFHEAGLTQGVEIYLQKRIPIAAGMAGGSTDAAAALSGLNELFSLGYSLEKLQSFGVTLGADIPYCLMGGTALSEGIGEILSRLPAPPQCSLLIVKPDISVSTKFVYENLRLDSHSIHPDIDGMVDALKAGSLKGITDRLGNVLETVTTKEYPVIDTIKGLMRESGAQGVLMSGSGPTVFGIFEREESARMAAERMKEQTPAAEVFVTEFV
ncbi:MAG: 4-(cytidine 5'-diphospho)-2-C-methyl-D-erythritol kinase [Lachnospiraceae bacterium]|nr:4-(cytidine 5'-diphospho)-2-C-methyl-D-erythritol kinase [Lachnospiraceae bacterium]